MPSLMQLIEQHRLLHAFADVLVAQLGAPMAAVPTMGAAAELAGRGAFPPRLRRLQGDTAITAAAAP